VLRRVRIWALGLPVIAVVGFAIPRWLVPDGLSRFRHDAHAWTVAVAAYQAAWMLNDNPIGRVLLPAARVEEVRHEPGSCPKGEPGSDGAMSQYTARVRFHSWFGIPGPSVRVTCGGWSVVWSSLARSS
jgi:hypothetical protein